MGEGYDLVVRDAYVHDRNDVVDIGIEEGNIRSVSDEIPEPGETEIDADGNLVSPGLIDCHVHLDQALTAEGDRFPRHNDEPFDKDRCIGLSADYFADVSREEITQTVLEVAGMFAANGTLSVRTHAYVDSEVGTKVVEGVLAAKDRLAGVVDLQVVVFPQRGYVNDPGTEAAAREALELGADVVGGIDPASINTDIERSIETWFDLATAYDVEIDAHIHDGGTLGMYTLSRLAEKTIEHDYQGRVTASHAFALADTATDDKDPRAGVTSVAGTLDRFKAAELKFVTCYPSIRPGHPVERFHDEGLVMAHGTDEVRDMWVAHGNADVVEGALVSSFKLSTDYAYATNSGLDTLWQLLTTQGAQVLELEDYGIEVGTNADLVVWDQPSPQWTLITQGTRTHVIKEGSVIATDGALSEPVATRLSE